MRVQSRARTWLGVGLSLAACSGDGTAASITGERALAAGVVSSVDGVPIALTEVQQLAEAGALSPKDALARLQAEALLAGEAARRGYEAVPAVEEVARQARVQALLAGTVERQTATAQEVEQAYAKSGDRFDLPEKRASAHVLAALPANPTPEQEAAAEAFARDAVERLKNAPDWQAVMAELQTAQSPLFKVSVEVLPAAPVRGQFVREFNDALFEVALPGVVPRPVRTQYGWHAIVVTEIVPAVKVDGPIARAELQRELDLDKRKRELEALLGQLQSHAQVHYDPKAQKALAALEP